MSNEYPAIEFLDKQILVHLGCKFKIQIRLFIQNPKNGQGVFQKVDNMTWSLSEKYSNQILRQEDGFLKEYIPG